jgi:hypothetical protein
MWKVGRQINQIYTEENSEGERKRSQKEKTKTKEKKIARKG